MSGFLRQRFAVVCALSLSCVVQDDGGWDEESQIELDDPPALEAAPEPGDPRTGVIKNDTSWSTEAKDLLLSRLQYSHAVVLAHCASADARFDEQEGIVVRDVVFEVLTVEKGALLGDLAEKITATIPGGVLPVPAPNGLKMTSSPHSARYEVGRDYLLFMLKDGAEVLLPPGTMESALVVDGGVLYEGVFVDDATVALALGGQ